MIIPIIQSQQFRHALAINMEMNIEVQFGSFLLCIDIFSRMGLH